MANKMSEANLTMRINNSTAIEKSYYSVSKNNSIQGSPDERNKGDSTKYNSNRVLKKSCKRSWTK